MLCLSWLYGLFVRTLISHTNAYASCSRTTLNFIEHFDFSCSIPTAKPLQVVSVSHSSTVGTDYVELFSMNVNFKMFCIFCLCIILCDTSKVSENLTLILSSVLVVIISVAWISDCRKNYIRFISKLWCAWGSKCNFGSRGKWWCCWYCRSQYKQFYSVRNNYAKENLQKSSKMFTRAQSSGEPLMGLLRVGLVRVW